MGGSRKHRTLAVYSATMTARAQQYRAQAKFLREQAAAAATAERCHELLEMAEDYASLAESIEGLRFHD